MRRPDPRPGKVAGPAADAIRRGAELFAGSLIGIVAYGSWARNELVEDSDIDLLVVLDERVAITRDLYRTWDASPIRWEGRPLEPHFVHLPDGSGRVSGTWAEAALDGIVLFEQGLIVSHALIDLRRRIVDEALVPGTAQGQRYWTVAPVARTGTRAQDELHRAKNRLGAVDVLFEAESWADVVRESQEIVELALKALLRSVGIDPPRIHDVSDVLLAERERLPETLGPQIDSLAEGSRQLRRDRELAFYGAEDLTPSGFYSRADAEEAREIARTTVALVKPTVAGEA